MNLVVDLGNTYHKVALMDDGAMVELFQHEKLTIQELNSLFAKYKPQKAILSSVVKNDEEIRTWLQSTLPYIVMSHELDFPFKNCYATPETLGTDRIAAVVGGRTIFKEGNLLVIQAGSCVTFDFIDEQNNYWGGSIAPGILMRLKALHDYTGKLPLVHFEEIDSFCGNSSSTSILAGVTCGIASEIDGMIARYEKKYENLSVILSGGSIKYFDKWLKNSIFANPNLVIVGLNTILKLND